MSDPRTTSASAGDLEERITRLEDAIAAQASEVRSERFVLVDTAGRSLAELSTDMDSYRGQVAHLLLYSPKDGAMRVALEATEHFGPSLYMSDEHGNGAVVLSHNDEHELILKPGPHLTIEGRDEGDDMSIEVAALNMVKEYLAERDCIKTRRLMLMGDKGVRADLSVESADPADGGETVSLTFFDRHSNRMRMQLDLDEFTGPCLRFSDGGDVVLELGITDRAAQVREVGPYLWAELPGGEQIKLLPPPMIDVDDGDDDE